MSKEFETTQQEKETLSYFDWDDARLGAFVKHTAQYLFEKDTKGLKGVSGISACYILACLCGEANAGEITVTLSGFTLNEKPAGDFKITVTQTNSALEQAK